MLRSIILRAANLPFYDTASAICDESASCLFAIVGSAVFRAANSMSILFFPYSNALWSYQKITVITYTPQDFSGQWNSRSENVFEKFIKSKNIISKESTPVNIGHQNRIISRQKSLRLILLSICRTQKGVVNAYTFFEAFPAAMTTVLSFCTRDSSLLRVCINIPNAVHKGAT